MQSVNLHQHQVTLSANKWALTENLKKAVLWFVLILAVTTGAAYTCIAAAEFFPHENVRSCFISFFLAIGVAHIFIFPKWLKGLETTARFLSMLALSSAISLLVFFVFVLNAFNGGLLPFASGAAFLLPYCMYLCWYYFSVIKPVAHYNGLYFTNDEKPDTKMSLLLNSVPFSIKMKAKENDTDDLLFNITFTGKMELGRMFCRFLHDHQDVLETTNKEGQPYGWLFYLKKWYGIKALDPAKSISQNGVEEDDIIIVKRLLH